MKYITLLIITFALFSCQSQNAKLPKHANAAIESNAEAAQTSTAMNPQVGVDFLNAYIQNCNKMRYATDLVVWTNSSKLVTNKFKTELEKMVNSAWKRDPDLGLDFDPIFDAQDYPDEGIELLNFDAKTGYLTVKGINWESFHVAMKLVLANGQTLVDGCGVVNIPLQKRAKK